MKILVIFTGGTIGSTVRNGYIGTEETTGYTLIDSFRDKSITFETSSPYTILSENLSAKELNILQKELDNALKKDYDGIIITHGTDTLQYSAAAIEYAFGKCSVPVIFVSAAFPLEDERTNGFDNFNAAVEFIRYGKENGVFAAYKNSTDKFTAIHIASRLLQHSEGSADLYSIDGTPFAVFDGKHFDIKETVKKKTSSFGIVEYVNDPGILLIESHPADSFSYSLDGTNAVIMKPYHSATIATASENLKAFCKRAKNAGIPIFISGVKEGASYESTRFFEELGISPLPYETFICSYMKIWAGISCGKSLY